MTLRKKEAFLAELFVAVMAKSPVHAACSLVELWTHSIIRKPKKLQMNDSNIPWKENSYL